MKHKIGLPPYPGWKWCPQCVDFLHPDSFHKNISSKDGLQGWCTDCKAKKQRVYDMKRRWKNRARVIVNYGGVCTRCKEDDPRVLVLDHIDPALAKYQKRELRWSNDKVYRDAVKRNYPDDYQILCWNCNTRKAILMKPNACRMYEWIEAYMGEINAKE